MTSEQLEQESLERACIAESKLKNWGKRRGTTESKDELVLRFCKLVGTSEIDIRPLKISEMKTLISNLQNLPRLQKQDIPSSIYRQPYLDYLTPIIHTDISKLSVPSLKLLMEKIVDKTRIN